ncbi:hypothetical protein BDB00DRAFT_799514 [Zychaea mexicana]|uniref:uncharacterized protein n=1 Tax=Zychaea mexicana TaxID=64656 RepID=UPI0022FEDF47|nr:uncharacterized protein BDB00DRAFT_799514 [Zychaea mexicana]KAI9498787.1 hypothetical protein BDB00DRAFT_799514 [Zychaea mexicana]
MRTDNQASDLLLTLMLLFETGYYCGYYRQKTCDNQSPVFSCRQTRLLRTLCYLLFDDDDGADIQRLALQLCHCNNATTQYAGNGACLYMCSFLFTFFW